MHIKKANALVASQILPFKELSNEFADCRAIIFSGANRLSKQGESFSAANPSTRADGFAGVLAIK